MLTNHFCLYSPSSLSVLVRTAHGDNMCVYCCVVIFADTAISLVGVWGSALAFSFQNGGVQPSVDL